LPVINQPITYIHKTHPKSRSIKIKIESSEKVVVVTPKFTPKFVVDLFVKKNKTWIEKTLVQIKTKENLGFNKNGILIFGKKYKKDIRVIGSSKQASLGVKIKGDQLVINLLEKDDSRNMASKQYLNRFLKNTATKYILPRTQQLASKMKIDFGKITLREQKTRWGSCSNRGNLNFNWRLVHHPPEVIDYVIIHELSHRQHMDHSKTFWNLVEKFDPEYQKNRGWLKRRGMSLG